jgi:hypothetical protein
MINFLEAAVIFLLATNAASVLAALYAHADGERGVGRSSSQGRYRTLARRDVSSVELRS